MVNAMTEQQRKNLLDAAPRVTEQLETLKKYKTSVEDMAPPLAEVVDIFKVLTQG